MLKVGSILSRELVTVAPECPVERAQWLMRERKLRHLPVVEDGRLVGMLSERDLLERPRPAPRPGKAAERTVEVRDRMGVSLETVQADESVPQAARRLFERRVGSLPVIAEGRLVGVVSESDCLRLYVRVCRMAGRDAKVDPPLERCMSRDVLTATPTTSVLEAFELCRSKGIRHLPVVFEGWLVGIVSDRDLLPVVGRGEGARRVEDVMSKDFVAVTGGTTPLSEAAACMLRDGFHALPVVESGALRGIVTSADVLHALAEVGEEALESAWRSQEALAEARVEE
ncbi:MAG TPA: CBS domain-containing protein [Planctomycetota bacterium]